MSMDVNEYAYDLCAEIDANQLDTDEAIEILIDEFNITYAQARALIISHTEI